MTRVLDEVEGRAGLVRGLGEEPPHRLREAGDGRPTLHHLILLQLVDDAVERLAEPRELIVADLDFDRRQPKLGFQRIAYRPQPELVALERQRVRLRAGPAEVVDGGEVDEPRVAALEAERAHGTRVSHRRPGHAPDSTGRSSPRGDRVAFLSSNTPRVAAGAADQAALQVIELEPAVRAGEP